MIWFFLLLPFFGISEENLAPPFPLIPGDPLQLQPELKQELYSEKHALENSRLFGMRQFPIFPLMAVAAALGFLAWAVYNKERLIGQKNALPIISQSEILQRLQVLEQNNSLDSRSKIDQLASLVKLNCSIQFGKSCGPMTWEEISAAWEGNPRFKQTLQNIDELAYSQTAPDQQQLITLFSSVKSMFQSFPA